VAVEELKEVAPRKRGVLGFVKAGMDAFKKKSSAVEPLKTDVGAYDVVLVGTPVWAGRMCPAVRTFLTEHGSGMKQVGFFLTTGGTGKDRTFGQMEEVCGKKAVATLGFSERELKDASNVDAGVRTFVETIGATG